MKSLYFLVLLILLGMSTVSASTLGPKVLEDSRSKFILEDVVIQSEAQSCDSLDDRGAKFVPENAAYLDGNAMPFRYYRVALPTKDKPTVSVSDVKTVPLGKPLCKIGPDGTSGIKFESVHVSTPVLRDGLWMAEIRVPLYVKRGSSVALRKDFKLNVHFNGSSSGVNPGKRALGRVKNPRAASRFGVSRVKQQKAFRKAATDQTYDVEFLARFKIGDRNMATSGDDGLYKVAFEDISKALSTYDRQFELDGHPVDRICLYGASPDTLADQGPGEAERNPNQIFEIPIEIRDHTPNSDHSSGSSSPDGTFNKGDTLVFVGYGNSFWKRCDREDNFFINGRMDYFHSYSPYSFYQYFLFGIKGMGKGLRLSNKVQSPSGKGKDVRWMRYVRVEKDLSLIDTYFGKGLDWEKASGKEWFWQWHGRFETTTVRLSANETSSLPGLVSGGSQYVAVTYFPHRSIWAGGAVVAEDQMPDLLLSGESYETRMKEIRFNLDVNGQVVDRSETALLPGGNFRVDNPGLMERGNSYTLQMLPNELQFDRFDGYTVAYQWNPVVDSAEWLLPGEISGIVNVPVPSGTQVMKFVNLRPVGFLTANGNVAKDSVSAETDVRYLAVRSNVFRDSLKIEGIPAYGGSGVLTDISRPNTKMEYLIISPIEFLEPAASLAAFRSGDSAVASFATSVVALEDIYKLYTAGRMSPIAIRNYIAYAYSVCPNLRYVLLVGAGHFDYRGLSGHLSPMIIPPFEKEDGVTEDFFAILDSGEVCRFGTYDLDVAVGRLPVTSAKEFAQYVEKAKDYEKIGKMDYSDWRSNLLLAADDAKNNGAEDHTKHTEYQETVSRFIDSLSSLIGIRWNMKKIYLLDYTEDAAGQKKDAADDFLNILNQGALFTTYFGHGSKTDWAGEGLLKPSYISKLSNQGRYTILGSFSCTVGRFDEGNGRSLSEEFLLAPAKGSIASVGAARETFASYNEGFGENLLLNALLENGETIGNAFLNAKRSAGIDYSRQRFNNERYVLLGEPVIKMPSSELKVSLDVPLDTIKALDKMKLSGTVDGLDDGYIDLVLREGRWEKRMSLQLSDDDTVDVFYDGGLIYSEKIPVKSGRFMTEFVTPRKISIGDTNAEFSAWAYSSKVSTVGRSWIRDLVIGGVSDYADSLQDTVAPTIRIQTCNTEGAATDFSDGETIRLQAPACLQVVIEDSTALDYREQADEGITFELVGVQEPFHPWPYLEQNSKRAKLRMNFGTEQYPPGMYVFKVRALDVLDNESIKTVNVEITDDMETGLADVFNVPNPMGKKGTTFYFKDLTPDDRESKVNIFIYNQNGKLVRVLKNAVSGVTRWYGHDNHGRLLANGLYHYVVRSEVSASGNFGKKTWTKKQKLLISR